MSCMIDQDLDLCPQRKRKMQKHTDWKIEKHLIHSRKLLSKYTQKKLQTAFFSDNKVFKKKQLYNSQSNVVYVLKKMRKVRDSRGNIFQRN